MEGAGVQQHFQIMTADQWRSVRLWW